MKRIYFIPIIFFLVTGMLFWRGLHLDPRNLPSARVGKPLPQLELQNILTGAKYSLSAANHPAHYFLIHVWGSWCSACASEHELLLMLARSNISLYGINYRDQLADAREFLVAMGNPYQKAGIDISGKAVFDLGVYGAPETFLVDANGIIRHRHAGVLTMEVWQHDFLPLLNIYPERS